jgi:hypothetical protein
MPPPKTSAEPQRRLAGRSLERDQTLNELLVKRCRLRAQLLVAHGMRGKQCGNLRENFICGRGQYTRGRCDRRAVARTGRRTNVRQIRCGVGD